MNGYSDEGNIACGDKVTLTRLENGRAIFEFGGLDIYSEGMTDAAFIFSGVEYIEVPTVMEIVALREAVNPPLRVPRDSTVFEFYGTDVVSEGGMVTVSEKGVVGGREVFMSIGFIVAENCEPYHGELPSGNKWQQ